MTHDKYDTDILKTLKSIDASLKSIAKSVQPVNTTVVIDNNSEEAVKEFLNSLHRKNVQQGMRNVSKNFQYLYSTAYCICSNTVIQHWIDNMVEFYSLYILRAKQK